MLSIITPILLARGATVNIGFQAPYTDCPTCPTAALSAVEYINTDSLEAIGVTNITVNVTLRNSNTFVDRTPSLLARLSTIFCFGSKVSES